MYVTNQSWSWFPLYDFHPKVSVANACNSFRVNPTKFLSADAPTPPQAILKKVGDECVLLFLTNKKPTTTFGKKDLLPKKNTGFPNNNLPRFLNDFNSWDSLTYKKEAYFSALNFLRIFRIFWELRTGKKLLPLSHYSFLPFPHYKDNLKKQEILQTIHKKYTQKKKKKKKKKRKEKRTKGTTPKDKTSKKKQKQNNNGVSNRRRE